MIWRCDLCHSTPSNLQLWLDFSQPEFPTTNLDGTSILRNTHTHNTHEYLDVICMEVIWRYSKKEKHVSRGEGR